MKIKTFETTTMKTSRIKKIILALFIGGIIILLTGCIKEDLSNCGEYLTLKFRYITSPESRSGSLFPEIDRLSVFVFDESGRFVYRANDASIRITDAYSMPLPLHPGCYRFIVWAGLDEHYLLPPCIAGETEMEEFILQLKRESDNTVPRHPALLYHGMEELVEFKPLEAKCITIGLRRITNTIRVIAHNLEPETLHDISIEDDNGTYHYTGEIVPDDLLTYLPVYPTTKTQADPLVADFNVMRLQAGRDARLKIRDASGTPKYNEALIDKLLGNNPNIDFDYDHDFTIEITFGDGYIPVSIKINGWEIIEEESGLG